MSVLVLFSVNPAKISIAAGGGRIEQLILKDRRAYFKCRVKRN